MTRPRGCPRGAHARMASEEGNTPLHSSAPPGSATCDSAVPSEPSRSNARANPLDDRGLQSQHEHRNRNGPTYRTLAELVCGQRVRILLPMLMPRMRSRRAQEGSLVGNRNPNRLVGHCTRTYAHQNRPSPCPCEESRHDDYRSRPENPRPLVGLPECKATRSSQQARGTHPLTRLRAPAGPPPPY